jgi:hypothetical protein
MMGLRNSCRCELLMKYERFYSGKNLHYPLPAYQLDCSADLWHDQNSCCCDSKCKVSIISECQNSVASNILRKKFFEPERSTFIIYPSANRISIKSMDSNDTGICKNQSSERIKCYECNAADLRVPVETNSTTEVLASSQFICTQNNQRYAENQGPLSIFCLIYSF